MKKLTTALYLLLLYSCHSSSSTTSNNSLHEVSGNDRNISTLPHEYDRANSFKGIKFGSSLAEVSSILDLRDTNYVNSYHHTIENKYNINNKDYLVFCNHRFPEGHIGIFDGKFCCVTYSYDSLIDSYGFTSLNNIISQYMGMGSATIREDFKNITWEGENILVMLNASYKYNQYNLIIYNKQLMELSNSERFRELDKQKIPTM